MATSDRSELPSILPEMQSSTMIPPAEATAIAPPVGDEAKFAQSSLSRDAMYRLLRNRLAVVGLAFILLLFFCAIFANFIAPYGFAEKVPGEFYRTRPNYWFIFGTDNIARDVFTRIMFGARASMYRGLRHCRSSNS